MSLADGFDDHSLENVVSVLVRVVEAAGAAIIFAGAAIAFVQFLLVAFRREGMDPFAQLRLNLGRFLVLGLEFQLAADILRTAVAPNFTELAQLATVAAIRTALNSLPRPGDQGGNRARPGLIRPPPSRQRPAPRHPRPAHAPPGAPAEPP